RTRREHPPGRDQEVVAVEGRVHFFEGHTRFVTEWDDHLRREEERYRDGEARLEEARDPDARQRQLTRIGNAAAGAALALLMAGRADDAREWYARACDRYRESWD